MTTQGPQYGTQPPRPQRDPQRRQTVIGLAVLLLILVLIGVGSYWARQDDPDSAAVGNCVARDGSSSVKVVKCTDSTSAYKVVGKVKDKSQVQFNISSRTICTPYAGSKSAFWKGESGGKGYVLCLAPVK